MTGNWSKCWLVIGHYMCGLFSEWDLFPLLGTLRGRRMSIVVPLVMWPLAAWLGADMQASPAFAPCFCVPATIHVVGEADWLSSPGMCGAVGEFLRAWAALALV